MLSPDSAAHNPQAQFRWYLAGVGSWFASFGLQSVIVMYLITTVLHASPMGVSIAQASMNLPAVLLLLVGGAVADHLDNRSVLLVLHSLAAIPAALLAATVSFGWLSFEWLVAYGLAMGTVSGFIMPAREAMLGRVIVHDREGAVQRAVTNMLGVQFLAQMVGMAASTFARVVGIAPLLVAQSVIQLFGAYAVYNLAPAPARHADEKHSVRMHLARIADGLREVAHSPSLLPVTVVTFAIGVLLVGSFMVVLPLIIREEYGGTVVQYALLSLAFWGGSIIASLSIGRFGNIRERGRMITLAIVIGGGILMVMSIRTSMPVFYGLVFLWGTGAGIMISMARTIVQENAPPGHLARVMSVYQLGFTGGMPIGAVLLGPVVTQLGARTAALVPGGLMLVVLGLLLVSTQLWTIRSPARREALAPAD